MSNLCLKFVHVHVWQTTRYWQLYVLHQQLFLACSRQLAPRAHQGKWWLSLYSREKDFKQPDFTTLITSFTQDLKQTSHLYWYELGLPVFKAYSRLIMVIIGITFELLTDVISKTGWHMCDHTETIPLIYYPLKSNRANCTVLCQADVIKVFLYHRASKID